MKTPKNRLVARLRALIDKWTADGKPLETFVRITPSSQGAVDDGVQWMNDDPRPEFVKQDEAGWDRIGTL